MKFRLCRLIFKLNEFFIALILDAEDLCSVFGKQGQSLPSIKALPLF